MNKYVKAALVVLLGVFIMSAVKISDIFREAQMRRENHSEQFLKMIPQQILYSNKVPYKNGTLSWDSGNQAIIYNNGFIDSLIIMDYPARKITTRFAKQWEQQDVPPLKGNDRRVKFYREILPGARYLEWKYNIPIRVTLVQASIETGDGKVKHGNNYFGMKQFKSSNPNSMYQKVRKAGLANLNNPILKHDDCCHGKRCSRPEPFYNFHSERDMWDARALLLTGDRYKSLLSDDYPPFKKYRRETVWAWQLKLRGYATYPKYDMAMILRLNELSTKYS